jgi:hypothetical protein
MLLLATSTNGDNMKYMFDLNRNGITKFFAKSVTSIYFREFDDDFGVAAIEFMKSIPFDLLKGESMRDLYGVFSLPYEIRKNLIAYENTGTRSPIYSTAEDILRIVYFSDTVHDIFSAKLQNESVEHFRWNPPILRS